jgi:hypothetical protein
MVAGAGVRRIARHLVYPDWMMRRAFPRSTLDRIEAAIRESERAHRAELRFAAEGALDILPVTRGLTARERAIELFSELHVWDTEENCGVLIYVQLVDHCIEIVADRGVNACVEQGEWDAICRRMEEAFHRGEFEAGSLAGIREVGKVLSRHFSSRGTDTDELPNRPALL